MRAYLERTLNAIWYGEKSPGILLKTGEAVYRSLAKLARKRELAKRAADLDGRPIIVVGNLTAGGTGKTPLVVYLCRLLAEAGLRPGVISRGYGRTHRRQLRVTAGQSARQVGDEPLLVFRRTGVPVIVGRDRVTAARACFAAGVDVVISDDGLQRLRLPRTLEICVVDGARGLGNGHLLPAGPLREPARRLHSVDYLVVNGEGTGEGARKDAVVMQLAVHRAVALDGSGELGIEDFCRRVGEHTPHAVAGIGHPERFFVALEKLGIKAHRRVFPDHHDYNAADFVELKGSMILMTEKDAVKCADLGLRNAWYLPVAAELPAAWGSGLVDRVRKVVDRQGNG